MPLRVLIADDEPVARQRLRRLLHKLGDVLVVAECEDGAAAVRAIQERELDVVFLDVQMPQMSGFDVVRAVGADGMPAVIFVTAFDRFALQAFEAEALDYLLKPFGEDRVRKALARARAFLNGSASGRRQEQLNRLLALAAARPTNCLLVKDRDRVVFVRPQDIDWVEAEADYVRLHVGPEAHLVRSTLAHMEQRLAGDGFVRVHRSRLVNVERIKELRLLFRGESVVVLKTGARLMASQGGLKALQERFNSIA